MGVPARAAVEAPEGERASENGAQPRPDINKRQRLLMLRGKWLALRLSALRLPFYCGRRINWCVVVRRARAHKRRENGAARASLRASAKQSGGLRGKLDCFVAVAPRNDAAGENYSLLAVRPASPSTRATVSEPDRPNEKDSSMSSGFCLK
jgi:hypothetical protein